MLSSALGARARRLTLVLGRRLHARGVTPDVVSVVGLLLNALTGVVLARGKLPAGGALALVAGSFDMLDGAVARASGEGSVFGGFLDSTLDRYSEAAVLLGLLAHFERERESTPVALIYVTTVGSLMISYTRARAEGLGLKNEVGYLARPERVLLLSLALLARRPTPALWVLAVGTNVTAAQRVANVYRITRPGAGAVDVG